MLSVKCSCKAGQGERCEHVVAALLYCYRKGDQLGVLSCTDKKCEWKKNQDRIVKAYNSTPILEHARFFKLKRKCPSDQDPTEDPAAVNNSSSQQNDDDDLDVNEGEVFEEVGSTSVIKCKCPGWSTVGSLTKDQKKLVVEKVRARLKDSAFVKHQHEPIIINRRQNLDITDLEEQKFKMMFTLQRNELMEDIKRINIPFLYGCCENTLKDLYCNYEEVGVETKIYYSEWQKERRFRITGSTCYQLFTYTANKNPDWQEKCDSFFSPQNFRSEYTDYGGKTEGKARECFRKATNKDIFETASIICLLNSWLAFYPDGVILKDGKPSELLEIKCPCQEKSKDIHTVVQSVIGNFLIQDGENITFKKRHEYYGQMQLGRAVINVKKTSFVIYSSFDKRAFILTVDFDSVFVEKMLTALKRAYYQKMLHVICAIKQESENNNQNNSQS